jgi:hypothetical protein
VSLHDTGHGSARALQTTPGMSGVSIESEPSSASRALRLYASTSTPGTRFWRPEPPVAVETEGDRGGERPVDGDDVGVLEGSDAGTSHTLLPGMQLPGSRLRILARINDGGCGVVYRGEHVDLQRPVAIKVQRVERLSPGAREMFLDEARATTRIESPHVVSVVDFGELADGRVWYAMELLGGRSLDELIVEAHRDASGRMDVARAIALLRMACKGLAAAHAAGVVHRDVKPQNLVVVERGGREHLVLVDFGISVEIGTTPRAICGTPQYMAREQIAGGMLDARTDVYGLACCAYELLTGRSVVDGCTIPEALAQHEEGLRPTFTGAPAVPMGLQLLVRRCLAADPSERVASMVELEAALCEAQIAAGVANSRDDLELPAVAGPRRSAIVAGFARLDGTPLRAGRGRWMITAGVAAGVLGAFAFWRPAAASPEVVTAMAAPTIALAGMLAPSEAPDEPGAAASTEVIAAAVVSPDVAAPTTDAATVVASTGNVASTTSARPGAGLPEDSEAARPEPARTPGRVAHDAIREGHRALRRGDYVAAEDAFARALQASPRSADATAGLADVNFERGNHARALHYAELAVRWAPRIASHRLRLGDSYYRQGRSADARTQYLAADRMGSASAGGRLDALARGGR